VSKMQNIAIVLASLLLLACSSNSSRYKDNASLERPPEMPKTTGNQTPEQVASEEIAAPIRHRGKGLKSDVYKTDGSPRQFTIKRGFDESWSLLSLAIQHNDLKLADQDRSKGYYYITYNGNGFFGKAASYFNDEYDKSTYLLKVEPEAEETKVTASLANKDEQNPPKRDGEETPDDKPLPVVSDKSENLIELLYDTLHDDLKDE
jgi:uncharacterized lipoprotein